MYFQQTDSVRSTADRRTPRPDLVVLVVVWILTSTLGWCFGYWPPEFKPRWLYRTMLGSIFVAWAGVLVYLLIIDGDLVGSLDSAILILVAMCGLGGLAFNGYNRNMRDVTK